MNRRGVRGAGGREGFTLLEVLVALAILSMTLILAYRVISGAIAAEDRSERWTTEALLGDNVLRDTLKTFPDVGETHGDFPSPYEEYSWKKTVKQAVHPDAREVHVQVIWGKEDREESVTLSGLAAK